MTSPRHARLVAATWAALASAALASPPAVTATPARVMLGTDKQVVLEVRADDAPRLNAYASTGTLTPRTLVGPDVVRFTWTPPDVRYPHTAVLLFWNEQSAGPPELAVVRIPLVGRTDLDVSTEPRADVRVEVGDRTFGPRRADAQGKLQMPVEVPPGVTQARVMSEFAGLSKTVMVPLDVPPTNRLAAVAGPQVLPRSGGWAWVVAARPLDLTALRVEATGGVVALSSSLPDRALFTVRPSPSARSMSMTFRTAGAPEDLATVGLEIPEPPVAGPEILTKPRLAPGVLFGATYGGGSNLSLFGSVEMGVSVPEFGTALAGGVALEAHSMGFKTQVLQPPLGELSSWLVTFSPMAVARLQVFEIGQTAFHLRAGLGPLLFVHQISSDGFQPSWTQAGAALEAFGGVQVSYRVGPLDVLLDARGVLGNVQTPELSASIGGMVIGVGARVFR